MNKRWLFGSSAAGASTTVFRYPAMQARFENLVKATDALDELVSSLHEDICSFEKISNQYAVHVCSDQFNAQLYVSVQLLHS